MILFDQGPLRGYAVFLVGVLGVTGALLLVGYLPARSLGGQASVSAMFYACSVSLIASVVGGLPIAWARQGGLRALKLFVAAMALRLLTVMAVGVGVASVTGVDRKPFLLWLAISYLALLVVDTVYCTTTLRRPGKRPGKRL